jgi:hypothetical protein
MAPVSRRWKRFMTGPDHCGFQTKVLLLYLSLQLPIEVINRSSLRPTTPRDAVLPPMSRCDFVVVPGVCLTRKFFAITALACSAQLRETSITPVIYHILPDQLTALARPMSKRSVRGVGTPLNLLRFRTRPRPPPTALPDLRHTGD